VNNEVIKLRKIKVIKSILKTSIHEQVGQQNFRISKEIK
jgi:hypothetical protein